MPTFSFCPQCAAPLEPKIVDGESRRACAKSCGFVHFDNPTPVVAVVVEHDGHVLLARNRAWPTAFYGLITGFLERNETPSECAIREVREELGLTVASPTLIGVYAFPEANQVIIAYHVNASGEIILGHELVDYQRHTPNACQAWEAGTGLALKDWLLSRGHEPRMLDISAWARQNRRN